MTQAQATGYAPTSLRDVWSFVSELHCPYPAAGKWVRFASFVLRGPQCAVQVALPLHHQSHSIAVAVQNGSEGKREGPLTWYLQD